MKVVILCGGLGTRLREETEFRPKPMLPIGERPILWHIMKIYAHHGYKDFILCLGYKGDMIRDYFRNYHWNTSDVTLQLGRKSRVRYHNHHDEENWKVTLVETGQDSLTGTRVKRIEPFIGRDKEFFLTYGDGVGNVDINAALRFHKKNRPLVTITAVHPIGRFGELAFGSNGRVQQFNEKPQAEGGWINGGFFVLSRKVFDYLPAEDNVALEQAPLKRMTAAGKVMAYHHHGFWQPMDTYMEYTLLNRLWTEGKAPWKVW